MKSNANHWNYYDTYKSDLTVYMKNVYKDYIDNEWE